MEQSPEDLEFIRRQKLTAVKTRLDRVMRALEDTLKDLPKVAENDATHAIRKDLAAQWLRGAKNNIEAATLQVTTLRDGAKAVARRQNGRQ